MPHVLPPLNPMSEAPLLTAFSQFIVMLWNGKLRRVEVNGCEEMNVVRLNGTQGPLVRVPDCLGWWPTPAVGDD